MPWAPDIQEDYKNSNSDAYVNTYLELAQALGVGPAVFWEGDGEFIERLQHIRVPRVISFSQNYIGSEG